MVFLVVILHVIFLYFFYRFVRQENITLSFCRVLYGSKPISSYYTALRVTNAPTLHQYYATELLFNAFNISVCWISAIYHFSVVYASYSNVLQRTHGFLMIQQHFLVNTFTLFKGCCFVILAIINFCIHMLSPLSTNGL